MRTKNMTILILCICLLVTLTNCKNRQINRKDIKQTVSNLDSVYFEPEKFPSFPRGEGKLLEFINKNINKKIVGDSELKEGKVIVTFHIDTVGKVDNFRIVRSYNQHVDSEFVRVLKLMPNWEPGKRLINGTKGPWIKSSFYWTMPLKIPYINIK